MEGADSESLIAPTGSLVAGAMLRASAALHVQYLSKHT